ncbi:MAG TPA: magnesium chelatase subunit D family protein [Jatrophihabitans sp.]|jgi:magnesium chelatase subunit D
MSTGISAIGTTGLRSNGGFPFSAVLGADDMQLALLLNAVSPAIGGVLVRGEKGTAKSTAVRALAALLPAVSTVPGCRFECHPDAPADGCPDGPHGVAESMETLIRPARLVELPVGASEDRLIGSLDLERALSDGVRAFHPGLLAAAHRGILYVDEINLLADHLVDVLLDASAMGRNHVERDAISVSHPARFVLIGSMNPEEGELRPQLLDRFGLTVDVSASREPAVRVEVVRRRLDADADPAGFAARWAAAESELAARIVAAQALLGKVVLTDSVLRQIAEVCAAFDVDGMRADIVTARTAVAHAAWHGRVAVTEDDIRIAARLALPHRRRRNPFDEPGLDSEALDEALSRAADSNAAGSNTDAEPGPEPDPDPDPDGGPGGADSEPSDTDGSDPSSAAGQSEDHPSGAGESAPQRKSAPVGQVGRAQLIQTTGRAAATPGRRAEAATGRGRTVRALPPSARTGPIHLTATVQAAAPHQRLRGRVHAAPMRLITTDLRRAERRGKEGNLVLFVVDASGSMAARTRMSEVKAAVLSLLTDAYQRRDKVGLITFHGDVAELVLPPTTSVVNAARRLENLATGGRTPLAAGLAKAAQVVLVQQLRDPLRRPLVVLVTDGRADPAVAARAGAGLRSHDLVVVDCERGPVRLRLAQRLAIELDAQYLQLTDVTRQPLTNLVNERRIA